MPRLTPLLVSIILLIACSRESDHLNKSTLSGYELMQKIDQLSLVEKELSNYYNSVTDSATVQQIIDSLQQEYVHYPALHAILTSLKGNAQQNYKHFGVADSFYRASLVELENDTNIHIKGLIMYRLAKNHLFMNNQTQAFEAAEKSLIFFTQSNDQRGIYLCHQFMGNYYYLINNLEKAYESYKKAEELVKWSNNPKSAVLLKYNMANCMMHKQPVAALEMYLQSIQEIDTIKESSFYSKILNCLGEVSYNLGKTDKATRYYKHSVWVREQNQPAPPLDEPMLNLYQLYIETDNLRLATEMHHQLGALLTPESPRYVDFVFYATLLEIKIGAYQSASENLHKYRSLSDSISRAAYTAKLLELQKSNDMREKNLQIQLLEAENQVNAKSLKNNHLAIGILVLFTSVTTALLITTFKQKNRLNKVAAALKSKNKTIETINEQLQTASKAREKILSIVGHDLRGPVGSLKELLDLYLTQTEIRTDEIQKMLQTAREATSGTYLMLNNLLNWANSQQGIIQVNKSLFLLNNMVEQLLTELKISADLKNIHLQNRIQSDVLLWADPHMIQAILRNLLSNAIKFSPKSTAIQINAIASRTHCTIRICDEGQGMSSAVFEQILAQKENLLVSQHTSSLKGSGLGMLICADFIERQNGTFHFEPQKPHGSAFLVSLPQPPIDTANTTEKMEQHPIGQGQANLHFP